MNNDATNMTPEQKKSSSTATVVIGAVLALGFLVSTIWHLISFLGDIGFYFTQFQWAFEYGFDFFNFFDALTYPIADLMVLLGAVLLLAYSALTVILKGKKLRALFIIAFLVNMIALSGYFVSQIFAMFNFFAVADLVWVFYYLSWGVMGFFGTVCGIFKKKGPSTVFGVFGAIAAVLTLVVYIIARIVMAVQYDYNMVGDIGYIIREALLLVSIAGTLVLLRPVEGNK